jgi:pyruvate,water dikinase
MAVIIQQMIPADYSGVAFAINPVTGKNDEHVINAIYGTGEELVSGNVNSDCYTVKNGQIYKDRLVSDEALLNDTQILHISGVLSKLSNLFGKPQDIEFAFLGGQFYLLQSRAITSVEQKNKIIWDNSNIIESYPGLTLPLSFSFIEKMYAAVYRQLSEVLGITKGKINENAPAYENMLGLLNGRVYYNLNSWYKVLSLLPGYNINASFMEKMMGVKEKPDIQLPEKKAQLKDYFNIIKAGGAILKNLATVRTQKKHFVAAFDETYNQFKGKNFAEQPLNEILNDYHRFEALMVEKWKAPLVNDFFAMIYFGLLHKLCTTYFPGHPNLHNQLLATSGDIVTTEPIRRLPELVNALMDDPELKQSLLNKKPTETWNLLHEPPFNKQLSIVNQFIDDWGERCIAELKLETVTYKQDPAKLIAILQSYARMGGLQASTAGAPDRDRKQAEQLVNTELKKKTVKRLIFKHVLIQARYLISNRENLRYYRTKGFGMVRQMFLAFGKKLATIDYLSTMADIFYLKLDELDQAASGTLSGQVIKELIATRKKDYQLYTNLPLPERVTTYGKPGNIVLAEMQTAKKGLNKELRGIPCSPGTVKAKVRLLNYADEMHALDNAIMVTYATDPGWVVLFPSASGILTERGSLLSHAAIVSREMSIPCIVGIEDLMNTLKDGDEIIMDGSSGIIKIIDSDTQTMHETS